jgi:hypothetical protein
MYSYHTVRRTMYEYAITIPLPYLTVQRIKVDLVISNGYINTLHGTLDYVLVWYLYTQYTSYSPYEVIQYLAAECKF